MNAPANAGPGPHYPLRRAVLGDMAVVAKIHRLAFRHTLPQLPELHTLEEDRVFHETVVFPHAEVWLAEEDGVVAGFIAFRPGWIDHLYVHPDHQGGGVGRSLLAAAQAAHPVLRLWTFQRNGRARGFYERQGFQIEQETDGALNEEKEPDVLYFWSRRAVVEEC